MCEWDKTYNADRTCSYPITTKKSEANPWPICTSGCADCYNELTQFCSNLNHDFTDTRTTHLAPALAAQRKQRVAGDGYDCSFRTGAIVECVSGSSAVCHIVAQRLVAFGIIAGHIGNRFRCRAFRSRAAMAGIFPRGIGQLKLEHQFFDRHSNATPCR